MFKRWFCPDCKEHMRRSDVSRVVWDRGLFDVVFHRCNKCGSDRAVRFSEYLKRQASEGRI
jgi:RNase P subunit RPR2